MALEDFYGGRGEVHAPAALGGFGGVSSPLESVRRICSVPYFEINVLLFQAQQLTLPEPTVNGHYVKGFEAVIACRLEERLYLVAI